MYVLGVFGLNGMKSGGLTVMDSMVEARQNSRRSGSGRGPALIPLPTGRRQFLVQNIVNIDPLKEKKARRICLGGSQPHMYPLDR